MAKLEISYVCLVLTVFVADISLGCVRSSPESTAAPRVRDVLPNVYLCGVCGQPITIDVIINNQLQAPYFQYKTTISAKPQRELIYFLELAATADAHFKFSADFYPTLGYMITTINGVTGKVSDKTYWTIIEHPSGNSIDPGVSSYIPIDAQTIMFNFTTWETTHS